MSNKFLYPLHDESLAVLQNGTATLFLKSLKVNDLQRSKNVATDSGKYLTSDNSGGGGVVTTNKPVEDNSIVIYDGTTGDNIKYISGLKYEDVNSRVVVPDLESGIYLSLNDRLQKISNIQSATQSPSIVTNFNGEIHVAKIKSASHNTELEFETDGDAALTTDGNISFTAGAAGDIGLNTNSLTITCPDNAIRLNNKSVKFVITRIMNTFSGIQAGANINTGDQNTAFGYNSLQSINTGSSNTAIGSRALRGTNTGAENVAVGDQALMGNTDGDNNVAVGAKALTNNTTGNNNTSLGHNSLFTNISGVDNTAIGYNCLYNSTASSNTAIGKACMFNNTTGSANTAMGQGALSENLAGGDNTFIGRDAGGVGTAIQQCVGIGSESGRQNTFGCVSVGWTAGRDSTGNYNTAIGAESLKSSTGGSNTAVGKQSLLNNTSGIENTAIGSGAGYSNITGNNNTCLGTDSGTFNQTGSNNTFVGMGTSVSFGTNPSNSTSIGFRSEITASNQIVLGDNNITEIVSGTNGICNLGASNKKFNNIYGTTYHEGIYSGSLIKNFPVGSNNTFSFITTPPDLTSGDYNTFYGLYAGDNVEISSSSTCIGVNTMRNSADAVDRSNNTIVGRNAGQGTSQSTFKGSTMIGTGAGELQTTGDNNTLIGYNASTQSGNKTNSIAIGYEATALNDNQCCIGNTLIEKIYNKGNGTCDLGAATRRFKDLYLAGNIYGAAKNSINVSTAGDKDLYDDGTLRVWLDDSTSDDIEIEINTAPENITATKTYYLTSTSYKTTTTASGAIALAGTATVNYTVDFDFQSDEIMYIRIWSPTIGTSWGLYEITCINTNATDFTGHSVMCSVKRV